MVLPLQFCVYFDAYCEKISLALEAPDSTVTDVKSRLTEKDPAAGKDCGQKEKEATEDEMAGQHH